MLCFSSSQHLQVVESYVKHALMGHKSVLYSKRWYRFVIGGNTNAVDGCISTYWFMPHSGVVCILYTQVWIYQFRSNHRQEVMPPLMDSLDDRKIPNTPRISVDRDLKGQLSPTPRLNRWAKVNPKSVTLKSPQHWQAVGEGAETWGTSLCSLSTAPVACTKHKQSEEQTTCWFPGGTVIYVFLNCRSSLWEVSTGSKMSCYGQHSWFSRKIVMPSSNTEIYLAQDELFHWDTQEKAPNKFFSQHFFDYIYHRWLKMLPSPIETKLKMFWVI